MDERGRRHPALVQADEALELDRERLELERSYQESDDARLAERGIRAWLLAPTIAVYEALMAGEPVPASRLNPDALRRYPPLETSENGR